MKTSFPIHPEPHTYTWTNLEEEAIRAAMVAAYEEGKQAALAEPGEPFDDWYAYRPEPTAYLVLFEGAGKLLEFTKGNYLHGAKVEHIPLFTHPAREKAK